MTKTIKRVFVTLLLVLTLTVVVSAEPVHWYVKNNTEHKRPQLDSALSVINGHNACYLGKDEKVIYLTFDAGYENGNVEKILDILKKHNATGAFFILENLITRNTELVRRMANEGHLVCNHTARHKNMSLINDKAAFERELKALETVYSEYTGKELDKLAIVGEWNEPIKVSVKGCDCSVSGLQNKAEQLRAIGVPAENIARFTIEFLNKTLVKMTENIIAEYGNLPLVFAGGVMSNSIISKSLTEKFGATFALPELSSDNAVGIAVLASLQHKV